MGSWIGLLFIGAVLTWDKNGRLNSWKESSMNTNRVLSCSWSKTLMSFFHMLTMESQKRTSLLAFGAKKYSSSPPPEIYRLLTLNFWNRDCSRPLSSWNFLITKSANKCFIGDYWRHLLSSRFPWSLLQRRVKAFPESKLLKSVLKPVKLQKGNLAKNFIKGILLGVFNCIVRPKETNDLRLSDILSAESWISIIELAFD